MRFLSKMHRLESAIAGKQRWEELNSYITSIRDNRLDNPNVVLDCTKSIIESISKTILHDKGLTFDNSWSLGKLVKQTFSSLPIFSKLGTQDTENAKSILGSFENIARIIGEFRNTYGFFSHGQDLESEKFDQYLTDLVVESSDVITSFLIIAHSEDLKNRNRVFYEENDEFNRYVDETAQQFPEVIGVTLTPSRALYTDGDAYREKLLEFINYKNNLIEKLESSSSFITTRAVCSELLNIRFYLTEDEVKKISRAPVGNRNIFMILGHGYTKGLFTWVLEDMKSFLSEKEIGGLEEAFSKKVY